MKRGEYTVQNRIKALRKALGLTQQEFAEKLGSVQNTITGYETGRRVPSNQVLALMSRAFNVNEVWLRTGAGEMFTPVTRDEEIAQFAAQVIGEDGSFRRRLVSVLARLDENDWAVLEKIASAMAEKK